MYIVNTTSDNIQLMNITAKELQVLYKWYNDEEFRYATGAEHGLELFRLKKRYTCACESTGCFWLGIFISSKMIGFLKGQIKHTPLVCVWINVLMLDKAFQNKGYGTKVVDMLSCYTKSRSKASRICLAVSDCNTQGLGFWSHIGFKACTTIDNCGDYAEGMMNAVIMCKLL